MTNLKLFSDDGSENNFTEVSIGIDAKYPNSLLVSWKSTLESEQTWFVKVITGLQVFNLLIITSISCNVDLTVGELICRWVYLRNFSVFSKKTSTLNALFMFCHSLAHEH